MRDVRSAVAKCSHRRKYKGQSDTVRDVKWSPTVGTEFAFATDNGTVQKWEYRNTKGPVLRINAHDSNCRAIDWHPDGKHLMSAGIDRLVKVWDLSSDRRQRPQWTLRTPFPVHRARWRPEQWSPSERGGGSWQCTQLVTSYDRAYSTAVHLWDFRRPFMPFREMCMWESAPSDLIWQSQRHLLTAAGREGVLHQIDVQSAPKVIDRRPMQTFAISPTGEICVFSQKRPRRRPSDLDYSEASFNIQRETADMFAERSEPSRSAADDTVDESFLSSEYRRNGRPTSTRSAISTSSTPPSVHDSEIHRVAKLGETLTAQRNQPTHLSQVAYRGHLEGTLNAPTFTYLAQKYKTRALPTVPYIASYERQFITSCLAVGKVFEQNASYAQKTGAYRIAQTWRMFSAVITHELKHRAGENRRRRLLPAPQPNRNAEGKKAKEKGAIGSYHQSTSQPNGPLLIPTLLAGQGDGITAFPLGVESSSNVATPVARPLGGDELARSRSDYALPNPDQETIELTPTFEGQKRSPAGSLHSQQSQMSHSSLYGSVFEESQWDLTTDEINNRKAQMLNWKSAPKHLLGFDIPGTSPGTLPVRLGRRNSDESFGMFSQSSESLGLGTSMASYHNMQSHPPSMSKIPESSDRSSPNDPHAIFGPPSGVPKLGDLHADISKVRNAPCWVCHPIR
jgi:hypothetical protein